MQTLNTSFVLYILAGPAPVVTNITLQGANYTSLTPAEAATVVNLAAQQITAANQGVTILYINLSNGSTILTVGSSGNLIVPNITINLGNGIVLTNVVCLLETCNIMMADGSYKNIRKIQEGDMVRSALDGQNLSVVYCNSQTIQNLSQVAKTNHPYRIPAHFFANNFPNKDVLISGHHCVIIKLQDNYFRGVQVFKILKDTQPMSYEESLKAINNTTLRYFHIGLEGGKNAVYCDGLPVETLAQGEW